MTVTAKINTQMYFVYMCINKINIRTMSAIKIYNIQNNLSTDC